ncbi:MAG TPA: 7-cyano-7-deazaguanine synthase QueC [Phycisphaerales bacterium]|mgnify:CR=1 FL=1|nr:7-cyano-7-deazaguanine synthase QueC [Phycisphaerales bacterium]HMP35916.1 7-cyano-7-deazaguanine synthase QueC [Phycisphaerales bacterium]
MSERRGSSRKESGRRRRPSPSAPRGDATGAPASRGPRRASAARPCVVLLSGGMDSAVVLAMARRAGFAVHALSFDYGQRHRQELVAARRVAKLLGAERHVVLRIDLRAIGGSALTAAIAVPKGGSGSTRGRGAACVGDAIPVTYVPARNTIFLSCALGLAESVGARDLFIGVNAVDYSGYPDCRPAFVRAFERLANLATRDGVTDAALGRAAHFRVRAPLLRMSKAEIVRGGIELGVDFGLTRTCYDPGRRGAPCRRCDACLLRAAGFAAAGVPDPALRDAR